MHFTDPTAAGDPLLLVWHCLAVANDEMSTVGVSEWLRVARRRQFLAFLEPTVALFLTSLPVADDVHISRVSCSEVVSYTNYGLLTADFAATGIHLSLHARNRVIRKSPLRKWSPEGWVRWHTKNEK